MGKMSDFFFGEYQNDKRGALLFLDEVNVRAKRVESGFFTSQLNRFLERNAGYCTLYHNSSMPDFWSLLDSIDSASIGLLEIYARTDINAALNATLACDITLEHGILSLTPHWCAHTP